MIAKSLLVVVKLIGALVEPEQQTPEDKAALALAERQLEALAKEELFAHYAAAALTGLAAQNNSMAVEDAMHLAAKMLKAHVELMS